MCAYGRTLPGSRRSLAGVCQLAFWGNPSFIVRSMGAMLNGVGILVIGIW